MRWFAFELALVQFGSESKNLGKTNETKLKQ